MIKEPNNEDASSHVYGVGHAHWSCRSLCRSPRNHLHGDALPRTTIARRIPCRFRERPAAGHGGVVDRASGWCSFTRNEVCAVSASGGPDDFGYLWNTATLNWIDASSGADIAGSSADIGFSFKFYENTHSRVYVSKNGLMGFSSAILSAWQQGEIPSREEPNEVIAPHVVARQTRASAMCATLRAGRSPTVGSRSSGTWSAAQEATKRRLRRSSTKTGTSSSNTAQ